MKNYIAIIDYQLSNMFSVKHAFDHLGIPAIITSDPKKVTESIGAVLPGVGAFGDAMDNLGKFKLDKAILDFVKQGKPLLGVCLGLQLVFTDSTEFGHHKGLNLLKGTVVKFPEFNSKEESVRIPQIGWNTIYQPTKGAWKDTPLRSLKNKSYMYFVHSFYVKPSDPSVVTSLTNYQGIEYCSSAGKNNVFATQFHPEKSGAEGIGIYKDWVEHYT
jgi:imidazole glycerol-phosphate synthase subunit HisH